MLDFATLPNLEKLSLIFCDNISDQVFVTLSSIPDSFRSLTSVNLSFNEQLTDTGILPLLSFVHERLDFLSLSMTKITDAAVEVIAKNAKLSGLDLVY